ncbi:MAG: hypothetical protein JWP81_3361 [Ferruginibacter sp.]|nr:hypothetical protein [Ferruginibacter sp.]
MKLFTFISSLLLLSTANFAQSPACPNYFKRNNGNGICPDGQLKLFFNDPATIAPIIDSVYINGTKADISFGAPDISTLGSNGYIAYCITGSNTPPPAAWKIYYHDPVALAPTGCLVPEGDVLPITLKSFFAKRTGGMVTLSWQTSYELNASFFEVQQKSGSEFIRVGTVSATNNTLGNSYSFTDKNSLRGVSEYRLRLLSKDGEVVFSDIKIVKGAGTPLDFTIFPNPTVRNAQISITDINEPTDVQVINSIGSIVRTFTVKTSNTININDLQAGVYRVRLINRISGEAITKTLSVIQ